MGESPLLVRGRAFTICSNDAMLLKLVILRVQFPEPDSDQLFDFEELSEILMPCLFAIELHFLDASRRMLCSVFSPHESESTGLFVVFDWNTKLCALVDIGLRYVR